MKDAFSFPMPAGNNTEIDPIPQEAACSKGCFLSSNGYYGYQPVLTDNKCHQQGQETVFESMEVNNSDDGIQFNNYIDPEDRVKQRQDNITMGNRQGGFLRSNKRHYDYGDSAQPLKKRREHGKCFVLFVS